VFSSSIGSITVRHFLAVEWQPMNRDYKDFEIEPFELGRVFGTQGFGEQTDSLSSLMACCFQRLMQGWLGLVRTLLSMTQKPQSIG
jgi:hypothetical protein